MLRSGFNWEFLFITCNECSLWNVKSKNSINWFGLHEICGSVTIKAVPLIFILGKFVFVPPLRVINMVDKETCVLSFQINVNAVCSIQNYSTELLQPICSLKYSAEQVELTKW